MSTEPQTSSAPTSIHPGTAIGLVTLRVANLERSRSFYEGVLAFQPIEQAPGRVVLGGQDKQPLLELLEVPGAATGVEMMLLPLWPAAWIRFGSSCSRCPDG